MVRHFPSVVVNLNIVAALSMKCVFGRNCECSWYICFVNRSINVRHQVDQIYGGFQIFRSRQFHTY